MGIREIWCSSYLVEVRKISKLIDLSGERFGSLTVLERAQDIVWGNGQRVVGWLCECDCGNKIIVPRGALRSGNTRSCGCMRLDTLRKMYKGRNKYEFRDSLVIGYTAKGEPFYLDAEDYEKIKDYCWRKNSDGYIVATVNRRNLFMHRYLMDASKGVVVDHINHDTTDNRKKNMRCVSQSRNMQNAKNNRRNVDGVKGVTWDKKWGKWFSRITVNKKTLYLGNFATFDEAVAARKAAEEKYFGKYSYDNSMAASPLIEVA